mmetsp:Transcript_41216/g.49488  ORF Transcript_41216/g.49488 Transcript_41216/m.49488 type:complete len:386 (-) Transcript_41216:175-1332(-)
MQITSSLSYGFKQNLVAFPRGGATLGADEYLLTSSTTQSTVENVISSLTNDTRAVGLAWIISSAIFTTYSTTRFLKYDRDLTRKERRSKSTAFIDRPNLLTLYRFSGSLLIGLLLHTDIFTGLAPRIRKTIASARDFRIPAVFLFIANYSNSMALDRIGIPLTYTSKCGIPLITALLTFILDGRDALPGSLTLSSLLVIASGIALASWNSPQFETFGFICALISCTTQAALNVTSKGVMKRTMVGGSEAQRSMVSVAFVISIITVVFTKFSKYASYKWNKTIPSDKSTMDKRKKSKKTQFFPSPPAWISVFAILAYHVEYSLSFMFVRLVEPITFGTCDAIRRLSIIVSGQKMFGGANFTNTNLVGIALALAGALLYSITNAMNL